MSIENIKSVFEKFQDEFLKFNKVENKLSNRPDLHAFILLDQIIPGKSDIVGAAEHDEIFLNIQLDDLEKVIFTEDNIRDLVRCGVRIGPYGLCMFV